MNPAARSVFALCLEDFSSALPARLVRRFAQFTERKEGGIAKAKIAGAPSLSFSIGILKLADGQDGLIVAEVDEAEARPAAPPIRSGKAAALPEKTVRRAAAKTPRRGRKAPKTAPSLSAEEMRAFKAIGRKVLRLCEEKKQPPKADARALPASAPASSFRAAALSQERSAQALADVLAVFDLVLFLDEDLGIVSLYGRAPRLGWRKAKLAGKSAGDLLAPPDRPVLQRMLNKLQGQVLQSSRTTLVVQGEAGNGLPCRAVLGRWGEGGAEFFLALLSLELPARLKRLKPANAVAPALLAA